VIAVQFGVAAVAAAVAWSLLAAILVGVVAAAGCGAVARSRRAEPHFAPSSP